MTLSESAAECHGVQQSAIEYSKVQQSVFYQFSSAYEMLRCAVSLLPITDYRLSQGPQLAQLLTPFDPPSVIRHPPARARAGCGARPGVALSVTMVLMRIPEAAFEIE